MGSNRRDFIRYKDDRFDACQINNYYCTSELVLEGPACSIIVLIFLNLYYYSFKVRN